MVFELSSSDPASAGFGWDFETGLCSVVYVIAWMAAVTLSIADSCIVMETRVLRKALTYTCWTKSANIHGIILRLVLFVVILNFMPRNNQV